MGTSTDGQICYGIAFDEGFEFPWHDDDGGDIESWWIDKVHGYKPPFECYDADGNYLPGFDDKDPRVNEFFDHRRAFAKSHPLPVEEVNYCSADYPMWILAVPGTVKSARRGFPEEFDPTKLVVSAEETAALLTFCKEHRIEVLKENKPRWWLSSYWG